MQVAPQVADGVAEELGELRVQLSRMAEDLKLKGRNASSEIQDMVVALEKDMHRFAAEVDQATQETREDVRQVGERLRARFQKLLTRIAMPAQ